MTVKIPEMSDREWGYWKRFLSIVDNEREHFDRRSLKNRVWAGHFAVVDMEFRRDGTTGD